MSEDFDKRPDLDLELISLNTQYELQYWKETLGCEELTLRKAVAAVGNAAENVRAYLLDRKRD
ncbi:DUF3606 domain-containing protein [Variovorax ureilyticus]|uniref:DUF3606 domain-containing protein n=1 Tax=Variovorax ureilyticus TaxID=1836198 RepID=A0ABU8VH91_9BURK